MFRREAKYWSDFDRLFDRKSGLDWTSEELAEVLSLYQGELLPGFYDEWAVLERERARAAFDHKMKLLLERLIGERRWESVLEWGERWIALGQVPEGAYRALMIAHAGMRDLSSTALTYQRCAEAFERELGLEPSEELQELYAGLKRGEIPALLATLPLVEAEREAIEEQPPSPGEPPFKGLEFFDIEDADLFFGREALTAKLVAHLRESRFLAVVGASGSGKSSVVRAGLVCGLKCGKALADGSLPPEGSEQWQTHIITPGAHPLESLAANLCRDEESVTATAQLMDDLAQERRSLKLFARRSVELRRTERLLLIVDQFEELFTLCWDENERAAFIGNLVTAAGGEGDGPTVVVIALRADFYAHCSQYPELRQLLAQHQEYIGPMSSEELRRAIEEPADQADWEFQPGLVDLILHDAQGEPGSLPLLSHALLETWGRRSGRVMTLKGYAEAGGVRGAIARTADTVYNQQLSGEQQMIARNIFLRLTELGVGTQDTRRRARFAELVPNPEAAHDVQEVLGTLAEARLVTLSEESAEVAHEALIREWPRLHEWLVQDRQSLLTHRHLTEAAQQWEAMERDEGELYRGGRLSQALEWGEGHADEMNRLEQEFLGASRELEERREAEREAQRQRELDAAQKLAEAEQQRAETQARSNRRLRWFAVGLSVVLLVAIFAAGLAYQQSHIAKNEAHLAKSRELAAAAVTDLEVDPQLSLNLALAAVSEAQAAGQSTTREAEEALHKAVQTSRLRRVVDNYGEAITATGLSPDGRLLAAGGADGIIRLWDVASGEELKSWQAHHSSLTRLAFDPSGKRLASYGSGTDRAAKVWETSSGNELLSVSLPSRVGGVAFSPDGETLAVADRIGTGKIVDAQNGEVLLTFTNQPSEGGFEDVAFSPDGQQLATAGIINLVKVWDISALPKSGTSAKPGAGSGQAVLLKALPGFTTDVSSVRFSPNGALLAATGGDLKILIWDTSTWEPVLSLSGHAGFINDFEFSPDGKRLASAGFDAQAILWDLSNGERVLTLPGQQGPLYGVDFTSDGKSLITGGTNGIIGFWNVSLSQEWLTFPTTPGAGRLAYAPSGAYVAAGFGPQGAVKVWDTRSGVEVLSLPEGSHRSWVESVAFSPDGSLLATASLDGMAKLWRMPDGQLLHTLSGHAMGIYDLAFSPDGKHLATAGGDSVVMIWDVQTGQKSSNVQAGSVVMGLEYSPDGRWLAMTNTLGVIKVLDVDQGQGTKNLGSLSIRLEDIAFSPDGSRLAVAGDDGKVSLWNFDSGELIYTLDTRGAGAVMGVAFSPGGRRLATANRDGAVILWEVNTGQELLRLSTETKSGLSGVAFSPDGKQLATSGDDAVRIYLLDIEDLIKLAEARRARTLTQDECSRYLSAEQCVGLTVPTDAVPLVEEIQTSQASSQPKVCMVTDVASAKDGGYNEVAYQGMQAAEVRYGWDEGLFEPRFESEYGLFLTKAVESDCDLIVLVGFTWTDIFPPVAKANPGQRFILLDMVYEAEAESVWSQVYATDQAAFLAGYAAAAVTKTGKVATFGGINIPAVNDFMIGFALGVQSYNQKHGTQVQVLGWDLETGDGAYTGDFFLPESGADTAETFLAEGADIIFPVAGPFVGLGAGQAVKAHGSSYLIGVDIDYTVWMPDSADIILTSVIKSLDMSVLQAVDAVDQGNFRGGVHVGTLENGGVGLASFYGLDSLIPATVKAELEQIKSDIIAGKIKTKP
jgi:WD40 repeat protein/basic membrane lipoprotein Med (substrate-binding protein (PBP1-ABC) superfamily)